MGILIVVEGLALIGLGFLGLQSRIIQKVPEATQTIARITRYQGWIGIGAAIWGLLDLIYTLRWIPLIGAGIGVMWISMFFGTLLTILLGILFGYGMIQRGVLGKASEDTKEKIEKLVARITASQVPIGFVAVIGGAWIVVYYLIISSQIFARSIGHG
ncbi:MAG TPA: hypothetical protein VMW87_06355 [Spirochaetia bacterium]|nr:hypothetical protein [Spirochaetia bacterium]